MDSLITETNTKLESIVSSLDTIKSEYEKKLADNTEAMSNELEAVKKYKEDFFEAKKKVEKMNSDIEGFENDYQNLVDRFKDDELANILITANKEISAKIEERKRKIVKDKKAMNELVSQAEVAKEKLVKLTADKTTLEMCLKQINDACEFYQTAIERIVKYTSENKDDLNRCFKEDVEKDSDIKIDDIEEEMNNITVDESILEKELEDIEDIEDNVSEDDKSIEDSQDDSKEESEEIKEIVVEEENDVIEEDDSDDDGEDIADNEEENEDDEKDDNDEDDDEDKTIVMEAIIDTDEKSEEDDYNITDEEIEKSLNDLDDELEEDDSLYDDKK